MNGGFLANHDRQAGAHVRDDACEPLFEIRDQVPRIIANPETFRLCLYSSGTRDETFSEFPT